MKILKPVNILGLGAVNGLMVGLAFEKARVTYLNYQMSRAAREYAQIKLAVDFTSASWEPLTPLVSMLVFAIVGYFVRQCFINRTQLLLSFWFGLGTTAFALGYFMATSNPNLLSFLWTFGLVAIIYLVHWLWKTRPDSLVLLWAVNGVSTVIVVALAVQLAGLFFYWPELRSARVWLSCLVGVVAISSVFGAVVQFISYRFNLRNFREANVQ